MTRADFLVRPRAAPSTRASRRRARGRRVRATSATGLLVVGLACGVAAHYGSWCWVAALAAVVVDILLVGLAVGPDPQRFPR